MISDRGLPLELVRITEAAALAAARLRGLGDARAADSAAVDAMRRAFEAVPLRGTVVIGEGERDEAPMLFIGEKVGRGKVGDPEMDVAVDPLDGTSLCAGGLPDAVSVVAVGSSGSLLHAPDTYMEKMAVGPRARGAFELGRPTLDNLHRIADALGKDVADLTVCVQERPRHERLVAEIRSAGARVRLFAEGDVAQAIAVGFPDSGVDVLMGTGGAPEGVLAAAALRCLDGDFQGRLVFRNATERERARAMSAGDPDRVLRADDLARGDVIFAATGVTGGGFLEGVRFRAGGARTRSVVMRSRSGTVRWIDAEHRFDAAPGTGW